MILRIKGMEEDIKITDMGTILVVEPRKFCLKLIDYLLDSTNITDEFIFLDDKLNFLNKKQFVVIEDILNFSLNSKNIITKLYTLIESEVNTNLDVFKEFQAKVISLNSLLYSCLDEYNFDMTFDRELSINSYLKTINLKVEEKDHELIDKVLNIIEFYSQIPGEYCLCFFRLLDYFEDNEILEIIKYLRYKKIKVLFIEMKSDRSYLFNSIYIINDEYDIITSVESI